MGKVTGGDVTGSSMALKADLSPPEPLTKDLDVSQFSCGKPPLDDWLRERALKAEGLTARTYAVRSGTIVVGYYALATGSIVRAELPRKLRHNTPDTIPVMILARLAVDTRCKQQGLGKGMLKQAIERTLQVSEIAGVRGLLVHAIDDEAIRFYRKYGFVDTPLGAQTLLLPLETIKKAL